MRAIGAVVARFVHTEEVTGSNPVSPTKQARRVPGPQQAEGDLQRDWHRVARRDNDGPALLGIAARTSGSLAGGLAFRDGLVTYTGIHDG